MKKRKQKQHKDRESVGYRSIYRRYVIDDGWQEVPQEVVEVIDLRIERAWEEAYIQVCRERSKHKGKWLTKKACLKYEAMSWIYRVLNDNQYEGKVREMGLQLQKEYGVTEVEAINIMNGRNVKDYLDKYYKMKNKIPLHFGAQEICDEVLEEYKIKRIAI